MMMKGNRIYMACLGLLAFAASSSTTYAATTGTDLYLDIQGGGITIGSDASVDFGNTPVSSSLTTLTAQFDDYAWVQDLNGNDQGYYITVQSSALSGANGIIPASSVEMRIASSLVDLIAGNINPLVTLGSSMGSSYTLIDTAKVFLTRDPASNAGKTGKYGVMPDLRLSIPAFQPIGQYVGTITFTLIEN